MSPDELLILRLIAEEQPTALQRVDVRFGREGGKGMNFPRIFGRLRAEGFVKYAHGGLVLTEKGRFAVESTDSK